MKKLLSLLLAAVLVLSLLPASVLATEQEDCIYLSISFDGQYINDQNGNPVAYIPVSMEDIESVDLCEYGLDHMRHDADGDGEYETTALQLLIYAHENIYGGSWSEVNFDDIPGSSYFWGGIFGFTENLVYFHNGDFPVDESQQSDFMTVGATSDRIVLEAGDFLDVASFSCYAFLWDMLGGFHFFADEDGNYVHDYTANAGEALNVHLLHSFCDLMYGEGWVEAACEYAVYYGRDFGYAEGSVTTDDSGFAEIVFPEPGTYYVWCDGGPGSDDGTHGACDHYFECYEPCIVSAPGYARVTVTGATVTHIPAAPVKENEIPCSCEAAGSCDNVVYCQTCGEELSRETVTLPATGHTWDTGVYTAPTTEADAFITYTCQVCGQTKTETHPGTQLSACAIVQQPADLTAESGTDAQFKVVTQGEVVSWKWEYRKIYKWFDTTMEGFNTDTLTVPAAGNRNGYDYRCTITFADGTVLISEPAELTVSTHITNVQNPKDQTVVLGYKGQFTASAQGEGLKYQWEYKRPGGEKWIETAMEGAAKPTVYIESTAARDGYQYRCRITDAAGLVVYTEPAAMRVLSFTLQPKNVTATAGTTATFTVDTSVEDGFTYQWQYSRNGGQTWSNTTMTGYNTDTLTVSATAARNGYQYRCVLTGAKNCTLTSKVATLNVN